MMRKLNVAHLLASNFFGGPEKQLVEHARRIASNQIVPHIISFQEQKESHQLLDKARAVGIFTEEISSKGPFDISLIRNITAIIRREKIDLLCVHGYKANVVGRIASWLTGIPLIAISRGWTGEDARVSCYEWVDRIFLRFAEHVVAVSQGQKDKIIKLGIPQQRISVIHNAINLAETHSAQGLPLRQQLGLPDDALIVASAGRLSREKNYGAMIEVAREVVRKSPKVYFVVFGEGFLREELERQIVSADLGGRFILPGFRNDLQAVLRDIDIFMLPSFSEGLPNVVLEAFAVLKPVVATRVGGTPEVVEDGVSGFLTHPHEISAMAQHVLQLVEDPSFRRHMGSKGFERVQKYFTFEKQTQEYEELYLKITDS